MSKSNVLQRADLTVKVYAKGVTGAILEVERWDGQTVNQAAMRMKEAVRKYEGAEVRIY